MLLRLDDMATFKPITENQSLAVESWDEGR